MLLKSKNMLYIYKKIKKAMLSLIIDNRERAIFPFLDMEIKSFLYEKKQLNTGDFLIAQKPLEKALPKVLTESNKPLEKSSPKVLTESNKPLDKALSKVLTELNKPLIDANTTLIESNNYNIKACIERKTYVDFAASFRDGRYKSELNNMLELRKKTNCQLFFIIEGTAFPSINRTFSRIPYVCILGAINKLMLKYNIFIIQTENEQHTAKKLNELLTSYTLIMEEADNENKIETDTMHAAINSNSDTIHAANTSADTNISTMEEDSNTDSNIIGGTIITNISLTQRIQKTDEDILLKSWASLKGISLVLGKILMEKFTIKDLALGIITIEEIKTCKTAFGKTINKTAIDSLVSIRNGNTKNCAKMLSAIIGITVDFATKLFNIRSLKEICQYYQNAKTPIDYKYLSDIVINEKKLGPKKAINIYKLIF